MIGLDEYILGGQLRDRALPLEVSSRGHDRTYRRSRGQMVGAPERVFQRVSRG
jgi:hypothetical protein